MKQPAPPMQALGSIGVLFIAVLYALGGDPVMSTVFALGGMFGLCLAAYRWPR